MLNITIRQTDVYIAVPTVPLKWFGSADSLQRERKYMKIINQGWFSFVYFHLQKQKCISKNNESLKMKVFKMNIKYNTI